MKLKILVIEDDGTGIAEKDFTAGELGKLIMQNILGLGPDGIIAKVEDDEGDDLPFI